MVAANLLLIYQMSFSDMLRSWTLIILSSVPHNAPGVMKAFVHSENSTFAA